MNRSLPPSWLFNRFNISWIADDDLKAQLPFLYKILAYYYWLFFKLQPKSDFLAGGRRLFYYISRLHSFFSKPDILKIQIGSYTIFIDLLDARFLQVVNELRGNIPTLILNSFLSEGDTFVDVGANHGSFSIVASHLIGKTGKIFSFEPQERLANAVRLSLQQAPAVYEVFQIALGDINGTADYIIPLSYSGTAGLFSGFSGQEEFNSLQVIIRRCDDVLDWKNIKGNLFIKLDIEGGEYKFLQGAAEMIKTLKPFILMEINPMAIKSAGVQPLDILNLLRFLGYNEFCVETDIANYKSLDEIPFHVQHNILLKPNRTP